MSRLEQPAALAAHLLLGDAAGMPGDWRRFMNLAKSNVVLVRSRDAFAARGVSMPSDFAATADAEEKRIKETFALIAELGALCDGAGIECVFTKAFQHYPDMGHDIDLFVTDRSRAVDELLMKRFGARPLPGSFANFVSGKTGYEIPGQATPVEIHHGRIGHLGEHGRFARQIAGRRKRIMIAGIEAWAPSSEDQLLLQGLQRIYGHLTIRAADVCASVGLLKMGGLDWDYLLATSGQSGIRGGFLFYLACIEGIYSSVSGQSLPLPEIARRKTSLYFRDVYRVPPQAAAKYYLQQMASAGLSGDPEMFGRLALLPVCAGIAAARKIL